MKKINSREMINLFFSAFLIIAYIVCAFFFGQFAATINATTGSIVLILINVMFGLLLFYATRVGEGKAVKRFSLVTLLVMVLPSFYIIVASVATGLPFHSALASTDGKTLSLIVTLACTVLGYGIPYTFLSGFEVAEEVEEEIIGSADEEKTLVLEGGIEADLIDGEEETEVADEAEAEAETSEDSSEEKTEEKEEEKAEEENK